MTILCGALYALEKFLLYSFLDPDHQRGIRHHKIYIKWGKHDLCIYIYKSQANLSHAVCVFDRYGKQCLGDVLMQSCFIYRLFLESQLAEERGSKNSVEEMKQIKEKSLKRELRKVEREAIQQENLSPLSKFEY